MMCPDCKMKLQSRFPGHFVQCKCPSECFVDQDNTKVNGEWYGRSGGHKWPVPYEEDNET